MGPASDLASQLVELRRLEKLARLLKNSAFVWERSAPPCCFGECESPKTVIALPNVTLHCCHFYTAYKQHRATLLAVEDLKRRIARLLEQLVQG
jgi:hypothetical protein